jgi:hypothetical protein
MAQVHCCGSGPIEESIGLKPLFFPLPSENVIFFLPYLPLGPRAPFHLCSLIYLVTVPFFTSIFSASFLFFPFSFKLPFSRTPFYIPPMILNNVPWGGGAIFQYTPLVHFFLTSNSEHRPDLIPDPDPTTAEYYGFVYIPIQLKPDIFLRNISKSLTCFRLEQVKTSSKGWIGSGKKD